MATAKAGNHDSATGPTTNKVKSKKSKHTAPVESSEDEQDPDPAHELRQQAAKVFYGQSYIQDDSLNMMLRTS